MLVSPASPDQIKAFEEATVPLWGGRERLNQLFSESPDWKQGFVDAVHGRYQGCLDTLVPWVRRICPDLGRRHLFEVGCGTGSSTAAFATACDRISAFDIKQADVEQARQRLSCFGLKNATATATGFQDILHHLDTHPRVDGVLLFAVLEHMYVEERIEVLRRSWNKLPPGGIIIVCETPNRLSYFDAHTYRQPFMSMLPPELAQMWGDSCVNHVTRSQIGTETDHDYMSLREKFVRMGQSGPSYHEFEIAIGPDVHQHVISSVDDPEFAVFNQEYKLEQGLLMEAMSARAKHVNPVFSLPILYLILQKPH